jgi:hypothetical protein
MERLQPTPQEVLAILSEQKIEEIDFCLRALLDGVTALGITDLLLDRRNELADELELWRG